MAGLWLLPLALGYWLLAFGSSPLAIQAAEKPFAALALYQGTRLRVP
jgi:hypothetical protein